VQGRFLQRDPIGFAGGMGLYEFTGGSPNNSTDPLGLRPTNFSYRTYGSGLSGYEGQIRALRAQIDSLESHLKLLENCPACIVGYSGNNRDAMQKIKVQLLPLYSDLEWYLQEQKRHERRLAFANYAQLQLQYAAAGYQSHVEAIVTSVRWLYETYESEYLGFENPAIEYARDIGLIFAGYNGADMSLVNVMDDLEYLRYADSEGLYPAMYTGFKGELNDNSNTIRHAMVHFLISAEWSRLVGHSVAFGRDPGTAGTPDRLLGYATSDLGANLTWENASTLWYRLAKTLADKRTLQTILYWSDLKTYY
jgi:hypothetical protein